MKANELRLGNYIYRNGLMEVRVISKSGVKVYDHVNKMFHPTYFSLDENIQPIQLTEEWLLKFGFTHEGGYLWDCKDLGYQRFIKNHLIKGYFETHYANKHIQYIHQLQNLYFTLSGKELTL